MKNRLHILFSKHTATTLRNSALACDFHVGINPRRIRMFIVVKGRKNRGTEDQGTRNKEQGITNKNIEGFLISDTVVSG